MLIQKYNPGAFLSYFVKPLTISKQRMQDVKLFNIIRVFGKEKYIALMSVFATYSIQATLNESMFLQYINDEDTGANVTWATPIWFLQFYI